MAVSLARLSVVPKAPVAPDPVCCPRCGWLLEADGWLVEVIEDRGIARRGGEAVRVTPTEGAVLACLAAGSRVSAAQIYDALYWDRGEDREPELRLVHVYICKLRKLIQPLGLAIETKRSLGWRLVEAA